MQFKYSLFLFSIIFILSCEKRVWENPFDSFASKDIYSPSNLKLTQEGSQIHLNWQQGNNLISGFQIERQIEDGSFIVLAKVDKSSRNYFDLVTASRKIHKYKLSALAGSNVSNSITAFITPASTPIITQSLVHNLNYSSVSVLCNVSDDGGSSIVSKGVCWDTSPNPTISGSKVLDASSSGIFNSNLTNLKPNTKYYLRTFATNSVGTSYGVELNFILTYKIPGLQLFYPFNGNADDESGNKFNGTVIGVFPTLDRFGAANSAMNFSGQNGKKILSSYKGIAGSNSRTIAFWAKQSTKFINHTSILSYGGDPNKSQADFGIFISNLGNTNPYIGAMTHNQLGAGYIGNAFSKIFDNNWHHYAFVYESNLGTSFNIIRIYIDGINVAINVKYGTPVMNTLNNLPLVIGQFTSYDGLNSGDYRSYQGSLDDIAIWNRALSNTEVQSVFENRL